MLLHERWRAFRVRFHFGNRYHLSHHHQDIFREEYRFESENADFPGHAITISAIVVIIVVAIIAIIALISVAVSSILVGVLILNRFVFAATVSMLFAPVAFPDRIFALSTSVSVPTPKVGRRFCRF